MKKKIVALLLSLTMILGLIPAGMLSAAASPNFVNINGKWYEVSAAADPSTGTPVIGGTDGHFKTEGGDGRVWTDKTVAVKVGADGTIPSFDVTLSALGQNYETKSGGGYTQTRADVLFILDATQSMTGKDIQKGSSKTTRVSAMVDAVNNSLDIIFKANPNNRVMVVTYKQTSGSNVTTLMPLGSYRLKSGSQYITTDGTNKIETSTNLQKKSGTSYSDYTKKSVTLDLWTFTQAGIQRGIEGLITTISDEMGAGNTRSTVKTLPYVLLLTDGVANVSTATITGTIGSGEHTDGVNDGSAITAARTVLTAAYWKDQLTEKYRAYNPQVGGVNDASIETTFFTIGLSADAANKYNPAMLAPKLLLNSYNDGTASWTSTSTNRILKDSVRITKTLANEVRTQLNSLATGTLLAKYKPNDTDTNTAFVYTTANYVYQATSQNALTEAFEDLAKAVEAETVQKALPVNYNSVDSSLFGGVTFTDTLGTGMTVDATTSTSFTAKIGTKSYTLSYKSGLSNTATGKFAYASSDEKIILIVDKSGDNVVITWKVAAEILPVFDKQRDSTGKVVYADASPITVTYNVHITDAAKTSLASATDATSFFSNTFISGTTRGAAESIYEPQPDNPHYYTFNETTDKYEPDVRFQTASLVNVTKTANTTGTASNAGEAVFPVTTTGGAKVVTNYLGNNGKLTFTPVTQVITPVSITLKKVDDATSGILSGAVYTVKKSGAASGTDYNIGNSGTVTIDFTDEGTYTITEKTAPTGYQLSPTVYTVKVTKGAFAKPVKNSSDKYESTAALAVDSVKVNSSATGDYTSSTSTLTAKDTSNKITISGSKTWADTSFSGLTGYSRPTSITITLVEVNGLTETKVTQAGLTNPVTVKLSETNSWSFANLPEYRDGKKIKYEIRETALNGYTATYAADPDVTNKIIVTNTVVTGSDVIVPVTVTVKKVDSATKNPLAGAIFTLYKADGTTKIKDLTATGADGTATVTFSAAADVAKYVIKETTAPTGYTASDDSFEFEITKSLTGAQQDTDGKWQMVYTLDSSETSDLITVENDSTLTDVDITVVWDDDSNRDGKRPESVSFHIVRQTEGGEPEYLMNGTSKAVYTVNKPDEENDTWNLTVKGLPAYKDGKKYVYRIIELDSEGAEITDGDTLDDNYGEPLYSEQNSNLTKAKNTHAPELVRIEGTKTWRDTDSSKRPGSITINVTGMANGKTAVNASVTTDASADWKYEFTNLYKYDNGSEIVYTVSELTVDGYKAIVDGYDVTNIELATVGGSIGWEGDDDIKDKTRPESVTVILYQTVDGKKVQIGDPIVITSADDWSWAVDGLPKYDEKGNLIVYTIEEKPVKGYTVSYDGTDVINTVRYNETRTPVHFAIKKVDAEINTGAGLKGAVYALSDKDGNVRYFTTQTNGIALIDFDQKGTYTLIEDKAPEGYALSDTVYTIVIGGDQSDIDVKYNEATDSFDKAYALNVESVKSSDSGINEAADGHFLIVSDYAEPVAISVRKIWNDDNNKDGIRPASVTVKVYKQVGNAVEVEIEDLVITLSEENSWTAVITNLSRFEDGQPVNYLVKEVYTDVVTGKDGEGTYAVEIIGDAEEGFEITNTHTHVDKPIDPPEENPETSDSGTPALWAAVCMASVTALAVVFFARKKNEEN